MSDTYGYPRPQLERQNWICLNGAWAFALDPNATWQQPAHVEWDATIQVPFAPETDASGIHNTAFYRACWYQRDFTAPTLAEGERLILHFGAVDYEATVWVNGHFVTRHRGGYTPFHVDITHALTAAEGQSIVVRAEDDPHDLSKPRGKQDWLLEPHAIWYPRTTGIWQTVWLEVIPATAIEHIRWTPHLATWQIELDVRLSGIQAEGLRLEVELFTETRTLAYDTYGVIGGEVQRGITLLDPGIDDERNRLLWSPNQPTLIHARLRLLDPAGTVLDEVYSYTALREVAVQGERFLLNGRPLELRFVLDQGYWLESGLSAPNDAALRRDVELAKAMGFNGVRKHQKVEDPRYLYWADTLGLLVWGEMPSAYRFSPTSVERLAEEWVQAVKRDYSHPCIVAWVPFNESWGIPDLPDSAAQRHYADALYNLTKSLDRSRPVIGNDGWESGATDIIGVHDYDDKPARLAARYQPNGDVPRLTAALRPAGRQLILDGYTYRGQPLMLTEFGGIALSADVEGTWGYTRSADSESFAAQYRTLLEAVRSLPLFIGFCYTQFTDTYQETNGLLYVDRTPKFPLEEMALATQGKANPPAAPDPKPIVKFLSKREQQGE